MREEISKFIDSLNGVGDDLQSKAIVELIGCGSECPKCCNELLPHPLACTCDALVDMYSDGKGGTAISLLFPLYAIQDNFNSFDCICCDFADALLRRALYGSKQTLNLCIVLRAKSNLMQKLVVQIDTLVVSNKMSKTIILFCQEDNFKLIDING